MTDNLDTRTRQTCGPLLIQLFQLIYAKWLKSFLFSSKSWLGLEHKLSRYSIVLTIEYKRVMLGLL